MKLYFAPGVCSLSPHIALREAGLPFDLVKVDLRAKKLSDGSDFYALNPKGYVPALQLDDGTMLTEGAAMVQYIADQAPASKLAPAAGTMDRYRLMEMLTYISSELHKSFSPLFKPNCPDEWKAVVREQIATRLKPLNEQLAKQSFLMGETFTVADGYLFTILGWAGLVNVDLSAFPHLQAFTQRVAQRPHVHDAMVAEGLIKA